MAFLSDLEIAHCKECGKLYHKQPHREMCRECSAAAAGEDSVDALGLDRGEQDVVRMISKATGVSEDDVRIVIREVIPLSISGEHELVCVRCEDRPSLPDSDFCLHCQVELHSSLGEAAKELFSEMLSPRTYHERSSLQSVTSALEDKRRMTGSSHVRLVGGQRLKY